MLALLPDGKCNLMGEKLATEELSDIVSLRERLGDNFNLRLELLGSVIATLRSYDIKLSREIISQLTFTTKSELKGAGLSSIDPPSQATPVADPK